MHIGTFGALVFPLGNLIVPIIIWALYGKKDEFVNHHAREAVNFQLSLSLYAILASIIMLPLIIVVFGVEMGTLSITSDMDLSIASFGIAGAIVFALIILAIFIVVGDVVYTLIAANEAASGRKYRYPFTIRFITENATLS